MKTAIAAESEIPEGNVSEKGGRAPFYLIFDDKNTLIKAVKNPFSTGGGGAGYGVAKMLKDEEVNKVIVGKVGGNMGNALKEAGIEFLEATGGINTFIK